MKKTTKQLLIVSFSIVIMAVSINMFISPHQIAAGGVSGIGVLFEKAFGIDRSIIVLILNIVMLILAFIFLGRAAFLKTVFGSILLPVVLALIPEMMLVQDRTLSVVMGSVMFAIAVSILYKNETSSGGTTIPPLIIQKHFGINTSIGLLATDMLVVIFNIFVFGFESFLLATVSLIVTSAVMTYIETGMKRQKAVMITSETKGIVIRDKIEQTTQYPVTVIQGYNRDKQEKTVLFVVVDDADFPSLIHMIDREDQTALVVAYNVAQVHGKEKTEHPTIPISPVKIQATTKTQDGKETL